MAVAPRAGGLTDDSLSRSVAVIGSDVLNFLLLPQSFYAEHSPIQELKSTTHTAVLCTRSLMLVAPRRPVFRRRPGCVHFRSCFAWQVHLLTFLDLNEQPV